VGERTCELAGRVPWKTFTQYEKDSSRGYVLKARECALEGTVRWDWVVVKEQEVGGKHRACNGAVKEIRLGEPGGEETSKTQTSCKERAFEQKTGSRVLRKRDSVPFTKKNIRLGNRNYPQEKGGGGGQGVAARKKDRGGTPQPKPPPRLGRGGPRKEEGEIRGERGVSTGEERCKA